MAFSELEIKQVERAVTGFMERRGPPADIRSEIDFGYRIEGQSLELFEIRPARDDASQKMESAIAKAAYVKRTGTWKVYWQRADLKWHRRDPVPEVDSVEEFVALGEADGYGCFFG